MQTQTNQTTQHHKTRAEVLRERVVIDLALDTIGPQIGKLLAENGIELPGADWSHVFPNWLVAILDNEVIGCVQVMPAKPVGWLEFLHVKPSAPFKMRAIAIRKLTLQGLAAIYYNNGQYAACTMNVKNVKFEQVLTKMNCIRVADVALMVKRLVQDMPGAENV